jgi:hypothetical protein
MHQTFQLVGIMENHFLYQKGKEITTFECVFDMILEAHSSIGHSRDHKKHKDFLRETLNYFGIPGAAVQFFIKTCPTVSQLQHVCYNWFILLLI